MVETIAGVNIWWWVLGAFALWVGWALRGAMEKGRELRRRRGEDDAEGTGEEAPGQPKVDAAVIQGLLRMVEEQAGLKEVQASKGPLGEYLQYWYRHLPKLVASIPKKHGRHGAQVSYFALTKVTGRGELSGEEVHELLQTKEGRVKVLLASALADAMIQHNLVQTSPEWEAEVKTRVDKLRETHPELTETEAFMLLRTELRQTPAAREVEQRVQRLLKEME